MQAFAVYFVGYVARPIGAAIFGHFGDRIVRKKTLVTTLLMTGLVTFAVGLVPTYASIGIWGTVLLTILRLIQGVGVGGEWGDSVMCEGYYAASSDAEAKRKGRARGIDQYRWPNIFFSAVGLFSLKQAHAAACRSS